MQSENGSQFEGNPKTQNNGMVERQKITPIPKRRNRGKLRQTLKDGTAENYPNSCRISPFKRKLALVLEDKTSQMLHKRSSKY